MLGMNSGNLRPFRVLRPAYDRLGNVEEKLLGEGCVFSNLSVAFFRYDSGSLQFYPAPDALMKILQEEKARVEWYNVALQQPVPQQQQASMGDMLAALLQQDMMSYAQQPQTPPEAPQSTQLVPMAKVAAMGVGVPINLSDPMSIQSILQLAGKLP